MVQAVRMPMMGNTMETGLLVEWRVDEGESVTEDQAIVEVESEKAATEIAADQDGTLARVDVTVGEEVPPGTVLGIVLGPHESLDDAPPPRSHVDPEGDGSDASTTTTAAGPTADDERSGTAAKAEGERDVPAEREVTTTEDGAATSDERQFVSPSTRRLARELGVRVTDLEGSGIGGRITESDVRRGAGVVESPTGTPSSSGGGGASDVAGPAKRDAERLGVTVTAERPLSGIRKTIATRMAQSAREAPQVTLDREVDVDRALEAADELAAARDAPIGFVDVLVGASIRALEAHPEFNGWFESETHRLVDEQNVAIAIDTSSGLVTPVIRSAGERSLDGIAVERRRLTDAVIEGEHSMDDLQGGTFTISNLGMFDVDSFDPIINPPQVAILGVGRIRERDERQRCTLSLSFDHRVVDGADAARFLDTLTGGIEAPSLVVAERSAAGGTARRTTASPSAGDSDDTTAVSTSIASDLEARARDIASVHDWPVPEFEVQLDGDRPMIKVDSPAGASAATMKRLTYAACRDSAFADVVADLRDAEVSIATAPTK